MQIHEFETAIDVHDGVAILSGAEVGLEVFFWTGESLYQLYTQREKARVFKSPSTAVNFLTRLGVDSIVLQHLSNWNPDSYVNQSSRVKVKRG